MTEAMKLEVIYKGKAIKHEFYVMPSTATLPTRIIIGADLMTRFQFHLLYVSELLESRIRNILPKIPDVEVQERMGKLNKILNDKIWAQTKTSKRLQKKTDTPKPASL